MLGLLALAAGALHSYTYERRYVPGEVDQYEIIVRPSDPDRAAAGVTQHRTIGRGGAAYEEVEVLRARENDGKDLGEALDGVRLRLSLAGPSGAFTAWSGWDPAVRRLLDALQTFYVAQHPGAGAAQVRAPGDSYASAQPFEEDWTGRPGALAGQRRSSIEIEMTAEDETTASYRVRFDPPARPGPAPPRPWMLEDACPDAPNSFFAVAPEGDAVRVTWGCERTVVQTEVAKATGKIQRASLSTEVVYLERFCMDEDLADCDDARSGAALLEARLRLRPVDPEVPPERRMTNAGDGLEYVKIPAGSFTMGCVEDDPDCYPREKPAHRVTISKPYWMGRTEVTVAAFERYLQATGGAMPAEPGSGYMPGYNDGWRDKEQPMVKVSWDEARSFCAWAGGRLPTEAEWERAARGGVEGAIYPWGDDRSHDEANFWRSGGRDRWKYAAPVGSFSANGYGLYDMAGNVYEWTADWYDERYYGRSPETDPQGPLEGRRRVARGGGGFLNTKVLRTSARLSGDPAARNVGVGFRCVLPEGSSLTIRQRLERLFSEGTKIFQ